MHRAREREREGEGGDGNQLEGDEERHVTWRRRQLVRLGGSAQWGYELSRVPLVLDPDLHEDEGWLTASDQLCPTAPPPGLALVASSVSLLTRPCRGRRVSHSPPCSRLGARASCGTRPRPPPRRPTGSSSAEAQNCGSTRAATLDTRSRPRASSPNSLACAPLPGPLTPKFPSSPRASRPAASSSCASTTLLTPMTATSGHHQQQRRSTVRVTPHLDAPRLAR